LDRRCWQGRVGIMSTILNNRAAWHLIHGIAMAFSG
jgi:hypothetical protein